jgi:hypothetical protein
LKLTKEEKSKRMKICSNTAQHINATSGNVFCRVIDYIAKNMDLETMEFFIPQEKIADDIGTTQKVVSRAIRKAEKLGHIVVERLYDAGKHRNLITWTNHYDWKDTRDWYSTKKSSYPQKVLGPTPKKSNSQPPKGTDLKDTYIDTSFDTDQKKSRKEIKSKHLNKLKGGK